MQPDFSRDARIAPILTRIAQLPKKPRLLVTIDGPCGSGKSTLADALSDALNAPIIRMDDFFLPHALKTPQLLAIPGGNVDLERLMQNLYEDKCAGSIPQTVFQTLMQKYEAERAEKAEAVPELERKVRAHLENQVDTDRWLEIIRRYTEISELDETILFELVDRIEVGDTQKVNGQRICEVKVYYRYVGNVYGALAQERGQDYGEAI